MTLIWRISTVLSIQQYGTDIRIGALLELRHSLIRIVSTSSDPRSQSRFKVVNFSARWCSVAPVAGTCCRKPSDSRIWVPSIHTSPKIRSNLTKKNGNVGREFQIGEKKGKKYVIGSIVIFLGTVLPLSKKGIIIKLYKVWYGRYSTAGLIPGSGYEIPPGMV
jgi:hypothetical protein